MAAPPSSTARSAGSLAARWFVNVSDWQPGSREWDAALQFLPPHEQHKVQRFAFAKDQRLALGSRVLQRKLIQELFRQVPMAQIDIQRTPESKPYWRRGSSANGDVDGMCADALASWNYNVSHHGTVVAIVAHPHALVGVDVVQVSERPNAKTTSIDDFFRAFESYFNTSEWNYIRCSSDVNEQYERFYRLWSLKEAYIKAVGIGLGFSLLRAEFFFNERDARWQLRLDGEIARAWRFDSTFVDATHIVSVAYGPRDAMWKPETSSIFPSSLNVAVAGTQPSHNDEDASAAAWVKRDLTDLVANSV
ncbi:L-aminoadipate-semialdehyde dehydrogenase-phosphopantetheinyl, partial [Globisporangium splendens]